MKKQLLFLLVGIILSIAFLSPLSAFTQTNTDTRLITKTKAKVESVGVGSVVSIRLQNKKKLMGNIVQINSDDFIVKEIENGTEQRINYGDVSQVKHKDKRGLSTGVKAGIIVVGVLVVLSLIGNGFGG
jgi:hypothetical protein